MPVIEEENDQTEHDLGVETTDDSSKDDGLHLNQPHVCMPSRTPKQVTNLQKDEVLHHKNQNETYKPTKTLPPAPGWAKSYPIPYPPRQMFRPLLSFNMFNTHQDEYSQPCLENSDENNSELYGGGPLEMNDQPMVSEPDENSQSDSASDYNSATEEQQESPQISPSPQRQRRPKRNCPKPMFQYDDIVSAKRRRK